MKQLIKRSLIGIPVLIYEAFIKAKPKISLPPIEFESKDHFKHNDANIEWSYFTGVLETSSRKEPLGFEATFLR